MKIVLLLLLVVLAKISAVSSQKFRDKQFVVAEIEGLGKVRGRLVSSRWTARDIYHFYDIKYGEAPSGALRFKAPLPAKPWSHIRKATSPRKNCPALQDLDDIIRAEGETNLEDCLTLSVSTRDFKGKAPVMVYIHGEFLYEGTPVEASPEYLLERDVVLVSVRYRLAPFGFLSTMSEEIPGNAGPLDVILALEWVQKNIHEFGGDPSRVTLFGQVGGAALINALTMSPLVREGLFHKVIYQSATALTPAFVSNEPLKFTQDIAERAGCSQVENVTALNDCLMRVNVSTLLAGFSRHGVANSRKGVGNYGGVQIVVGGPSGFLPDHPATLIQEDKIRYYPTMGGVTKNAGTFLLKEIFEDDFDEQIPDDKFNASTYMDYAISHTNGKDPTRAWKTLAENDFFSDKDMETGTFAVMIPGLIDMCGTIPFKNPVLLTLQANARKLPNSTYLYSFDYEGQFNRYMSEEDYEETPLPFDLGVSLSDDNIYLFPWPTHSFLLNRRDTKVARRMVALWTSFATTGTPKGPKIPFWPPMADGTGPYLKIDTESTVAKNFLDEYTITVRNARNGESLVINEFFENYGDSSDRDGDYGDYGERAVYFD